MCAAWQLAVPAMGFTCLDHCQPGWNVARPTPPLSRLTSSSWPEPCSKDLTSSGLSKLFFIMPAIGFSLFGTACGWVELRCFGLACAHEGVTNGAPHRG